LQEGYTLLLRKLAGLSSGSIMLNSAHLQPHLLLDDAQHGQDQIAEMQLLSMILNTKVPTDVDLMPIIDVSGSMAGTPIQVAKALGIIVAYAQPVNNVYHGLFLTFDSQPHL
jgi:hypothetical protein